MDRQNSGDACEGRLPSASGILPANSSFASRPFVPNRSLHMESTPLQNSAEQSSSGGDSCLAVAYSPQQHQPLPQFIAMLSTFAALATTAVISLKKEKGKLPERLSWSEWLLLAVATHRLSRLATLDMVTSPLRAPFTRFEEFTGEGEVSETARGTGMRQVIGDLVSCPYCAGMWLATGLRLGRAVAPRLTALAAEILTLSAASNFLQHAYVATKPPR